MAAKKSSIPCIAFVGVPNVGKSSLINRLLGSRQAIVHETAHTTRDTATHTIILESNSVVIQDTPGFALKGDDELLPAAMDQLDKALESASAVVMVVNSTANVSPDERTLTKKLLKLHKPVLVAASQIDKVDAKPENYIRLGLGEPLPVSGHHNLGIDELRSWLGSQTTSKNQVATKSNLTVAIIGHPNAGKSSLLNALTGQATAVVSAIPGTTRDPIESQIQFGTDAWRLTDTAGVRRPGKIGRGIEYFSLTRTTQVIAEADIVLLVVDATNPGNAQDQRLAGIVQDAGRGLIVVMNKIDLLAEGQLQFAVQDLTKSLDFMRWAPIVSVSATTNEGISSLLKTIRELGIRIHTTIPTKEINAALHDMISSRPPASSTRFRPKLNYAVQTASLPLTITMYGAHPEAVHFSYRRYLENEFRKRWPLTGIPLKIEIRSKYKD